METLTDKVARLTAEKETLEAQSPRNETLINQTTIALEEARKELEQEQAAQVRIQVQEEKVESIKLPHDYNKVFDDPRANEIIEELIKRFQRQAYNYHNQEIADLMDQHKAELKTVNDQYEIVKSHNDEWQKEVETLNRQGTEMAGEITQLKYELEDALNKRDAAVREKEGLETLLAEKQSHIDKLRDEIAVGAKNAINVTAVETTDKLDRLVRESAEAKANRALARWAEMVPEVVAPPTAPEAATFPVTETNHTANNELDNSQANGVPADNQEVTFPTVPTAEAPTIPGEVQVAIQTPEAAGTSGKTLEQRVEALEARVIELEKVCNLDESRVA